MLRETVVSGEAIFEVRRGKSRHGGDIASAGEFFDSFDALLRAKS